MVRVPQTLLVCWCSLSRHEAGFARSPSRPGRSSSSVWSPREVPDSRRVSLNVDDDREFQVGSSTSHLQQAGPSQSVARDARTPSRQCDVDGDDTVRGRKGKRFSFASALFEAMKDRVRSRSPLVDQHQGDTTPPRGRPRDRAVLPPGESVAKEIPILGRVSEALGFETDETREHGDGWKEFRKGTLLCSAEAVVARVSVCSLRESRCIHISNILCNPCECPSKPARRLRFGFMEAEGRRASPGRFHHQADRLAGHHSCNDS